MREVKRLNISTLFDDAKKRANRVNLYCEMTRLVQLHLTPDLLKPVYRMENKENPMFGHCYVATEAMYHLLNSPHIQPWYGKDERNITHWWLLDIQLLTLLDPTCDQYYSQGKEPPYKNGIGSSFLTTKPSYRATIVIDRVMKQLGVCNSAYI